LGFSAILLFGVLTALAKICFGRSFEPKFFFFFSFSSLVPLGSERPFFIYFLVPGILHPFIFHPVSTQLRFCPLFFGGPRFFLTGCQFPPLTSELRPYSPCLMFFFCLFLPFLPFPRALHCVRTFVPYIRGSFSQLILFSCWLFPRS